MDSDKDMSDSMSISDNMDLFDDFEHCIAEFKQIEDTHTQIIQKLESVSLNVSAYNIVELKKMHQEAMEHIKMTGKSNFGALVTK
jgi:enoyl-[acyl-carrier-protein] reductase (NADH)